MLDEDTSLVLRLAVWGHHNAIVRYSHESENEILRLVTSQLHAIDVRPHKLKLKPAPHAPPVTQEQFLASLFPGFGPPLPSRTPTPGSGWKKDKQHGSGSAPSSPLITSFDPSALAGPPPVEDYLTSPKPRYYPPRTKSASSSSLMNEFFRPDQPKTVPYSVLLISGIEYAPEAQTALYSLLSPATMGLFGATDRIGKIILPDNFTVIFVSQQDAYERPNISNALLDLISLGAVHTGSGVYMPTSPVPFTPPQTVNKDAPRLTDLPPLIPDLEIYTRDLVTATRHHPELDGLRVTTRCGQEFRSMVAQLAELEYEDEPLVDHVQRVYRWVMGHRLRARHGNEQLLSFLPGQKARKRRTVAVIMQEILLEV